MQKLITTDSHVSPPLSLLDELPESYRQYFRRVERRTDGDYLLKPAGGAMMGMATPSATKIEGDAAVRVAVGACDEANPSYEPADVRRGTITTPDARPRWHLMRVVPVDRRFLAHPLPDRVGVCVDVSVAAVSDPSTGRLVPPR